MKTRNHSSTKTTFGGHRLTGTVAQPYDTVVVSKSTGICWPLGHVDWHHWTCVFQLVSERKKYGFHVIR